LFLAENPISLTDLQHQNFKAAFEKFIAGQEIYFVEQFKKVNDGEIFYKSDKELLMGVQYERKYDDNWHQTVGKILLKMVSVTHSFWRENFDPILSKKPSTIFNYYSILTAIYCGPKEGRSVETKHFIPRVNDLSRLVYNAFLMHKQKSLNLFVNGM
jgi:hypothetical protein